MILLLGGTSDTAAIASGLARAGFRVLVSTATDEPLDIGEHTDISRRVGRLDKTGMIELIRRNRVAAIVDAAHPYATAAHDTACAAAKEMNVACFSYIRPATCTAGQAHIHFAPTHEQAAELAFSFGKTVLLTTGANHLSPYVECSRRRQLPLVVRVLPRDDSLQACMQAGIPAERVIRGKGPFRIEENRRHIREFGAGVLVTKDSGQAGGVEEKLQAALLEKCEVVVLRRPSAAPANAVSGVDELLSTVRAVLPPSE